MGCLKRSVHRHPDWQFKITFDDNHELLIEFDNFDGNKTVATPEFFMALFLKEHLKAIKKEIGEKPKKLGFVFFDKTNQDKIFYWTTFETNFMESCNLLKIEYCLIDSETL
uniref:Uncharacterized protein n=1 Tax=Panagrolaimus sp. ES5 TaxID=591445 RepID=A0AC34G3H3_9BILA